MESRSSHRLPGPEPPRRHPEPQPHCCPDGDGVDRISGLPDDLLREVLRRLRCARAAARTSILSRRWSGLDWRHLPELFFHDVAAGAIPAALAQVTCRELSLLDINWFRTASPSSSLSVAEAASLLRAASSLAPAELVVSAGLYERAAHYLPFQLQLPCFHRTKSITLEQKPVVDPFLYLQATGGEFPVLERLSLSGCPVHIADLLSRPPRLRSLRVRHPAPDREVYPHRILVHSTTIEELELDGVDLHGGIDIMAPALKMFTLTTARLQRGVHVVAPVLKRFTLSASMSSIDSSITFSAPIVGNLSWSCEFPRTHLIHGRLLSLHLGMKEDAYVLSLCLRIKGYTQQPRNLQEIVHLPTISVLELDLCRRGHLYGPMVSNLLGICVDIQRLKLVLRDAEFHEACSPNCTCNQPQNWRSESIPLTALEVVEIENFCGSGHEIDLLKLLFRCAPLMKRVTLKPCPGRLPSIRACNEICNIFKENPSVKCYAYDSCGKKVVYALSTYASR